jgi:hypothetical protein
MSPQREQPLAYRLRQFQSETCMLHRHGEPGRLLKNSSSMAKPRNLECADNGGALDFLPFCGICESKAAASPALAAALQIRFSAVC